MGAVLECRGLEKAWGGIRALDGVDLAVGSGEILGLAGANGAGKSTLLSAIAGQVRVDGGRVEFGGRNVERLPPVARRRLGIARTFQAISVFARKSVLENAMLAAEYGSRRRLPPLRFSRTTREEAREALRFLQLDGLEGETAGELSVYEQKRLMLAMAVVPRPTVLLLDEPASGLSPREVAETARLLVEIREGGMTVVVVDHVMTFLREVANRLIVLHDGSVLAEGRPADVVLDPLVRRTWLGTENGTPA